MLDTRAVSFIADYFIIATANNERQMQAITEEIQKQLKQRSILPLGVEGTADSGWVLLDYNGVVVHLFSTALRDYYRLDKVWAHAPIVVRMQ